MSECKHDWLTPSDNRTTCKLCGRDGWVSLDEPSDESEELKNLKAALARARSGLGHWREGYTDAVADAAADLVEALASAQSPSALLSNGDVVCGKKSNATSSDMNSIGLASQESSASRLDALNTSVDDADGETLIRNPESPPPTTPSISARTREDIRYAKEIWKELALKPMCKDQDCNSYSEFSRVLGHLIAGLEYPDLCDHPTVTLTAPAESPSSSFDESWVRNEAQNFWPTLDEYDTVMNREAVDLAVEIAERWHKHALASAQSPSTLLSNESELKEKIIAILDSYSQDLNRSNFGSSEYGVSVNQFDLVADEVLKTIPSESPQPTTPSSSDVPTTMGEEMLRLELATAYQTLNFMIKTGLDVTPSQLKPICGSAKEVLLTWSKTKALQLTAESVTSDDQQDEGIRKCDFDSECPNYGLLVSHLKIREDRIDILEKCEKQMRAANEAHLDRIAELEAEKALPKFLTTGGEVENGIAVKEAMSKDKRIAELELEVKEACAGRDQWKLERDQNRRLANRNADLNDKLGEIQKERDTLKAQLAKCKEQRDIFIEHSYGANPKVCERNIKVMNAKLEAIAKGEK